MIRWALTCTVFLACGGHATPQPAANPCFVVKTDSELRAKDAEKTLEALAKDIHLSPQDEALRSPKSIADVRAALRRDVIYAFGDAATYAHGLGTFDGRLAEAALELYLGDAMLIASQILANQASWVGGDLRMARANVASEGATGERERILGQLVRVVEEGNKIADALGVVAPSHVAKGGEAIRALQKEAPNDRRAAALLAEYHRMRGDWPAFDAAMGIADAEDRSSPTLCYLKAMEELERHRKADKGAEAMRACLQAHPKFVRAQAALVLMATNPIDGLREIKKLEEMNPDHYFLMLLEPTLAAVRELWRLQNAGRHAAY